MVAEPFPVRFDFALKLIHLFLLLAELFLERLDLGQLAILFVDAAQKSSTRLLCSLQVLLQLVHLVLVEHHIVDFQGDFLLLTFDS